MQLVFWLSFGFILYTYLVYPLIISVLARFTKSDDHHSSAVGELPTISFIIAAYNEEQRISRKIRNIQTLDYPEGKIEIIVGLDGCTDDTSKVLDAFPDVRVVEAPERTGKPIALNRSVAASRGEVLVFTDVRQEIESSAVIRMVSLLMSQSGIGAVSGELVQKDSENSIARNVGLYWRYEKWIRANESRIGSVPGVTGALYCLRRCDFEPIPDDAILDDFEVPAKILRSGKKVKFLPDANIIDIAQGAVEGEMQRKVRTLTGNFQSFHWNKWLFNPFVNPIWWQFLSHKVFRLVVPYALVCLFLSSFWLTDEIYVLAFWLQFAFYVVATAKHLFPGLAIPFSSFALVFVSLNIAAVLALKRFVLGQVEVTWRKTS